MDVLFHGILRYTHFPRNASERVGPAVGREDGIDLFSCLHEPPRLVNRQRAEKEAGIWNDTVRADEHIAVHSFMVGLFPKKTTHSSSFAQM